MKRLLAITRTWLLMLLVALVASGCSLFNTNTGSGQNPAATQGAELGRLVTAKSIDTANRNAPVGETSTFTTEEEAIYAVVEAQRIDPGTTLFARWSRDGRPFEDSPEIKANQQYQDTYVEFHLQPVNKPIDPGNYTVQIFVDGNPAKQATFTVQS